MRRVAVLILTLFLSIPANAQTRAIPRTDLTVATLTGTAHGVILWVDLADPTPSRCGAPGSMKRKEQLTQAQYLAIGNGVPETPASFVGTRQDWIAVWNSGRACAGGGRPRLTTPSGEPVLGTAERNAVNGTVVVYTGDDIDIGATPRLTFRSNEYTGTFPNISTTAAKCGLTITSGQIQPGNLNEGCARLTR